MTIAEAILTGAIVNEREVSQRAIHESSDGRRWRYVFEDGSVLLSYRTGPATWRWEIGR